MTLPWLCRRVLLLLAALWAVLLPGLLLAPAAAAAALLPITPPAEITPATQPVIEQLRLKVPNEQRRIWLEAERATWEPWLASQEGFLGRELLWDPVHSEATLLIRWASRAQWKAIPQDEIDAVQARFEAVVRERLGSGAPTPFPLLYEGELINPEV
ncbi:MAG: TIGR03792 family protein [Cyanobacteriota bacterium]